MEFPREWMKTSELAAQGLPASFLRDLYLVPKQDFVIKTSKKMGGCLVFYTPGLKKYLERTVKQDQQRLEII